MSDILDEVRMFIAIGGRPTWSEWHCMFTPEMQVAAFDAYNSLSEIDRISMAMKEAKTDEEKLRIAQANISHIDDGEMEREIRMRINAKSLNGTS